MIFIDPKNQRATVQDKCFNYNAIVIFLKEKYNEVYHLCLEFDPIEQGPGEYEIEKILDLDKLDSYLDDRPAVKNKLAADLYISDIIDLNEAV